MSSQAECNQEVTIQVLTKARELIATGWCQGKLNKLIKGRMRYCMLGAINTAYTELNPIWLLDPEKLTAISIMSHIIGDYIVAWNDAPTRTQSEVLEAFDKAITQNLQVK